jgi:hypothetical protein
VRKEGGRYSSKPSRSTQAEARIAQAAHLVVPDHSKRFWLTVQSLCPKTERARQWLAANGTELMVDFDRWFSE